MSNWDKNLFIDHLRGQCTREVAKVGVAIIEFTEKHADDISWAVVRIMVLSHFAAIQM